MNPTTSKNQPPQNHLLLWGGATITTGYLTLLLTDSNIIRHNSWHSLIPLGAYLGTVLLIHLLLRVFTFGGSRPLLATTLFLCGIGFIFQFRMGGYRPEALTNYGNLALFAGLLLIPIITLMLRNERYLMLRYTGPLCAIISTALLAAILILGKRYRGMVFLPGNINPTEIIKLLMVIFLAAFLDKNRKQAATSRWGIPTPPPATLFSLALLWLIPMSLLVLQRDIGMIVQLNTILMVIWITATGQWSILIWAGLTIAAAGIAIARLGIHGTQRIETWLNPFHDPTGAGWQVLQSLSALFSGGLFGNGLGYGMHKEVPIADSDFIYAIIGEELGYIGCAILLAAYLLLFAAAIGIMRKTRNTFAQLLVAGLTASLAIQTMLNIAGVVKALPLTGVTLPFISHGGSSLIICTAMIATMLAISEPKKPKTRAPTSR